MKNSDPEEWFPIVDENGQTIGKDLRSVCHDGKSMLLHPVVHLHFFNSKGELYLQKRAETKDIQPGKWDTSVGGHVGIDESPEAAVLREATEELGLHDLSPRFVTKYIWQSTREKELINSFTIISDQIPEINRMEIDDGRFWTIEEIKTNLGKGLFTPNFEHEFKMISGTSGNQIKFRF